MVEKGIVASVEGGVTVEPLNRRGAVSPKLVTPSGVGTLAVGDTVAFVQFGDGTGVVLAKC